MRVSDSWFYTSLDVIKLPRRGLAPGFDEGFPMSVRASYLLFHLELKWYPLRASMWSSYVACKVLLGFHMGCIRVHEVFVCFCKGFDKDSADF